MSSRSPRASCRAPNELFAGSTVDEVGFRPLDRHEANLFLRLVSRYEKGSIVLTSNKHVRDWPEIFAGDVILTTAILAVCTQRQGGSPASET
jgi:DNA replication protein DnaC